MSAQDRYLIETQTPDGWREVGSRNDATAAERAAQAWGEEIGGTCRVRDTGRETCQSCDGGGEVTVNQSRPMDPQCDEQVRCSACYGTGYVEALAVAA